MRADSRPPDVVVIGGLNTDFSVRGPKLPTPDHPMNADEFVTAPGGKGLNQAVAAARLGASVALVGSIGADERGRTILRCSRASTSTCDSSSTVTPRPACP